MVKSRRALVAVLNWGLGHATRAIPVIRELTSQGVKVDIASDGSSLALLRKEFADLTIHTLPSYNIRYPDSGRLIFSLISSFPRLLKCIKEEHEYIRNLHFKNKYDFIISDNRYGCYLDELPSVFVGHQLRILLPPSSRFVEYPLFRLQSNLLKRFSECWVPDFDSSENYSGIMSHSWKPDMKIRYIGTLSRLNLIEDKVKDDELEVLAIISGPESQRTVFEEKLINCLTKINIKGNILRGLPHLKEELRQEGSLTIRNHCDVSTFKSLLESSNLVISRSGYSTIMDLSKTNKKALFIPTPGQPEQNYLARYLAGKRICAWQEQENIDLSAGIASALALKGFSTMDSSSDLRRATNEFLSPL